jgi:hypothetical protein
MGFCRESDRYIAILLIFSSSFKDRERYYILDFSVLHSTKCSLYSAFSAQFFPIQSTGTRREGGGKEESESESARARVQRAARDFIKTEKDSRKKYTYHSY